MEITVTIHESSQPIAIMKLKGEINAATYMEVVNKAQELFDNPARHLIIDLSEVSTVSSSGLVGLHKIALVYSGTPQEMDTDTQSPRPDFTHSSDARKFVKLLAPTPEVDEALRMAGLRLFFKIYTDLDSAIQSF
ncbi:MAG: STAS domain-containing protein [Chloroflexota bacterium]